MAKRDLYTLCGKTVTQSIAPVAKTASANGTAVDLKEYNSAVVICSAGLWTDGTHTFSVQESDDNSTFTAVSAANLQGTLTAVTGTATDNVTQIVGYTGTKRYIRAVVTITSTSTGAVLSAEIVRGHPRHQGINLMT